MLLYHSLWSFALALAAAAAAAATAAAAAAAAAATPACVKNEDRKSWEEEQHH